MPPEYIIAATAIGTILVGWGVTVGMIYAHVAECARFRRDMVSRLERIENNQMANARTTY